VRASPRCGEQRREEQQPEGVEADARERSPLLPHARLHASAIRPNGSLPSGEPGLEGIDDQNGTEALPRIEILGVQPVATGMDGAWTTSTSQKDSFAFCWRRTASAGGCHVTYV